MAYVIIDKNGVGGAMATGATSIANKFVTIVNETNSAITCDLHAGTVLGVTIDTPDISVQANDFKILEHVQDVGVYTLQNVKTAHGTAAVAGQNAEEGGTLGNRVYLFNRT
jgi:hypothetical protein